MASAFGPLRLIVDARAGRGVTAESLPRLRAALDERGLEHTVVETGAPAEARRSARAALDEGCRFLVAVGGDGIVNDVVNGMFAGDEPVAPGAVFGAVGWGTAGDFVRTFGLDRKPEILAKHFDGDTTMPIDVGVAEFVAPDRTPTSELFVNVAQVGYGADAIRRAARMPSWFGRFRDLFAAYGAIARLPRQEVEVEVSQGVRTMPLVDLVVANGQFFFGGSKVAPRALPDDGRFNVLAFTGGRSQVFVMTKDIYRGEHLPHPQISEWQSPTVAAASKIPLPVEADGRFLGSTPASFRLLPRALPLKI